jgi:hypothetical protein
LYCGYYDLQLLDVGLQVNFIVLRYDIDKFVGRRREKEERTETSRFGRR